jgi:hypothetical protein
MKDNYRKTTSIGFVTVSEGKLVAIGWDQAEKWCKSHPNEYVNMVLVDNKTREIIRSDDPTRDSLSGEPLEQYILPNPKPIIQ